MATTQDGTEFHLGYAVPSFQETDLIHVVETLRTVVRDGDGVFIWKGRVFLAIASTVPGAGLALKRMMELSKKKGLEVRIRLVEEPFAPELAAAASQIILGDVPLNSRLMGPKD